MTDKINIPEWAWKRAVELSRDLGGPNIERHHIRGTYSGQAFARFIMKHEAEQIDPLLIEAREICAKDCEGNEAYAQYAADYRAGYGDNWPVMRCAYAAIKAGASRNG